MIDIKKNRIDQYKEDIDYDSLSDSEKAKVDEFLFHYTDSKNEGDYIDEDDLDVDYTL